MISNIAFAQDKDKLKNEKQKLQEEINYYNKLLLDNKAKAKLSLNQILLLNKKIEKRKQLINAIDFELRKTITEIKIRMNNINELNNELKRLKEGYAKMVYAAHKNRNVYNRLMFVFSAEDFNQAYKRLRYIQQYNEYLKKQVELIKETEKKIGKQISELNQIKNTKEQLKKTNEQENSTLVKEKKQQDVELSQLKKNQKKLQQTLNAKQKAAIALQRQIEAIIAREIAESARKNEKKEIVNKEKKEEGKEKKTKTLNYILTPEEQKLSRSFSENIGKLPWPTVKGVISSSFGEHPHPALKGIMIKNNGIDIATEGGAQSRAVFDGKVSAVINIPGANKAIIIRHGAYLSVYSNLSEVYVNKGDIVKTKQNIGKIATDASDNKTELHFEIWRDKSLLNPATWLAR